MSYLKIILVICVLCSCHQVNERRAVDDHMLSINIERSFVRAHAQYNPQAGSDDEDAVRSTSSGGSCNFSTGGGSMDSGDWGEAVLIIAAVVVTCLVIDEGMTRLQDTDIFISPKNTKKKYMQRLYWGENVFYYPHELGSNDVDVSLIFTGAYDGVHDMTLHHDGHGRVVLK